MKAQRNKKMATRGRRGVGRSKTISRRGSDVVTRWSDIRAMSDSFGVAYKRYFKLETLASAVDYMIQQGNDRFIQPTIQQKLGPAPITSLQFKLAQESSQRIVFRMRAGNARKKLTTFAFVVSKKPLADTTLLSEEHAVLRTLYKRSSKQVLQTFRGGAVYLPDRYRRTDKGREIYCYLTEWLPGFDLLGLNKEAQCVVNTDTRKALSKAETEHIKQRVIEIILSTYDPKQQNLMALPDLPGGDFLVKRTPNNDKPMIKLAAARKLYERAKPGMVLSSILSASWDCGEQIFQLAPDSPADFQKAVAKALGKETAEQWIRELLRFVARSRKTTIQAEYLQALMLQSEVQ